MEAVLSYSKLFFLIQVSWVRHRDIHLLTVGRYTYTSDQRFEAQHKPRSEEWALRIRSPQRRDSGQYECQISTTPPIGHAVYLNIVGEYNFFAISYSIHLWRPLHLKRCFIYILRVKHDSDGKNVISGILRLYTFFLIWNLLCL